MKGSEKIGVLTAYDAPTASIVDEAGIEVILVGDSLGTVLYGEKTTIPVTMDMMLQHTRAVSRGVSRALVLADMPFMSYQASPETALLNAARFLKEAGAHAVKLEGGVEFAPLVQQLSRASIPVCGHIGLMPQSFYTEGKYRSYGKQQAEKQILLDSALALEEAGAFMLVLECVDVELAREITKRLRIPTIGIGSGDYCDGQVLVFHDLVGLTVGHVPKFVNPTLQARPLFLKAIRAYIERTKAAREDHALRN